MNPTDSLPSATSPEGSPQPTTPATTPVTTSAAVPAYSGDHHTLVLPVSGLTVKVTRRRAKVADAEKAAIMAGKGASGVRLLAARVAIFTTFDDGKFIPFEDVLGWWEDDVAAVAELRGNEDFLFPPAKTSSSSPTSPAGA